MGADDVLVGHSGFVGETLKRQRAFGRLYNSSNIGDLSGQSCATLYCAAAPAAMWAANQDPAADKANLAALARILRTIKADRIVLISTIAVFDDGAAGYTESNARYETGKAYGRHRRELEVELAAHFGRSHIVRLPALFGAGMKKNFVFDLLNPVPSFVRPDMFATLTAAMAPGTASLTRNLYSYRDALSMWALDREALAASGARAQIEAAFRGAGFVARDFTSSASRFQYYNMARLADDLDWVVGEDIPVLNMCSEPVGADEICRALTGAPFDTVGPVVIREDVRSEHAARFGGRAPYLYDRASVLDALAAFCALEAAA